MIRMNGWQIELEIDVTKKEVINENAENNHRNVDSDNDDQGEVTVKRTQGFSECFAECYFELLECWGH